MVFDAPNPKKSPSIILSFQNYRPECMVVTNTRNGTERNGMERRFKVLKHGTMARDKILKHGTLTKKKLLKHGTLIAT